MKQKSGLRRWELALMVGVALAALVGAWLGSQQDALAERVVRLHVIANSDDPEDQAVKLQVRDAVLRQSAPLLDGLDRDQAQEVLGASLREIGQVAAETLSQAGFSYPVRVSLGEDYFPTKRYTDFSLPAGTYTALRVELGAGTGQNWWCVVFPPLCLGSVSESVAETALAGGLEEGQVSLMTGETQGYVVKFKAIEWWEEFKSHF